MPRLKTGAVLGLLCLLSLGAAPLQAQRQFDSQAMEHLARRLFYSMDMDKNGTVSREEYEHTDGGGFNVAYDKLDADHDGELTWDEYLGSVRNFHPSGPPRQSL